MISAIHGITSTSTSRKKNESARIVDLLLRHRANPNIPMSDGFSALHAAVVKGSFEIANLLLANGAEVNTTCQNGRNVALVNLLLERGIDPNAINTSGFTALHVAVIKDSHAIAELLLKNNAQVDAICENGTPLLIASETRASATVVELHIKNGADANKTNTTGCTGLHLAALKDSYAVAQVLLANKADVDVVCEKGTPLHIAAGRGNLNLIRLLLQHEANPDISDTVGRKAIEVAAINGFKDSVVILFPLTSPINEYENWSIDVIMRDAKNQRHG